MSKLVLHANEVSEETFGALAPETTGREMAAHVPVMATPAAVAAGVGITVVAFAAGFAAEEAADG